MLQRGHGRRLPGDEPDEVDALLLRHRYGELLRLVGRMKAQETASGVDPRFEPARKKIRAWLLDRADDPDIVEDPTDRRYQPVDRVRHLALGAALDDPAAKQALDATIVDPDDDGVAPFIGAIAALDLDLAGAADRAAKRLLLARTQHTERRSSVPWGQRGRLTITEHVELIDRLAARGDARFALGLLDRQVFAREAAAALLARQPLQHDLETLLGRPLRLANDANCLAMSEAADGAGAGARTVFAAILGTGVGGGIVVDRTLLVGANAIAGEWGHNPLPLPTADDLPLPACYCGRAGCIETWLTGPGMGGRSPAPGR